MMPIAPLMIEHRLIERMIELMNQEVQRIRNTREPNPGLIEMAVDFIRSYADRCHHGKEEDILFRRLSEKPVSAEHKRILDELIEEHVHARNNVRGLVDAKERFTHGDRAAWQEIERILKELVEFYPVHIEKEDKRFFIPVMAYFSQAEQTAMLNEFWDFDRKLIHERYKGIVENLERGRV